MLGHRISGAKNKTVELWPIGMVREPFRGRILLFY